MNLAKAYLETAYQDQMFTPEHLNKLDIAGLQGPTKELLAAMEAEGSSFAAPGSTPMEAARELESQQMRQFQEWRGEFAAALRNPRLEEVALVFVELSSPQGVTVHEQDNSYAIALDRRMVIFLSAVSTWAYAAIQMGMRGGSPTEVRLMFCRELAESVQLSYTKLQPSADAELRLFNLRRNLDKLDRDVIGSIAQHAAKFVILHELAHVHLGHFALGTASSGADTGHAEISAFREQELEFEADALANQHLAPGSLVAKVAAPIYFYVLAMMEAMVPPKDAAVQTMFRVHPASVARAERLSVDAQPPGEFLQFVILCTMPEFLKLFYQSESFQAAARAVSRSLSAMYRK